jgi:uroporphyrin-III C-methyltransferase
MAETKDLFPETIPKLAKPTPWRTLVLLVVLFLIASQLWQWYAARQRFAKLEFQLASRLTALTEQHQQTLALVKNADERSTEAAAKSAILEQKLQETLSHQQALESMYYELANSKEDRVVAEAEQLLDIASQQLLLAGNSKSALIALQIADTRLQSLNTPQAITLKQSIRQDIERLQNLPAVDIASMTQKLDIVANSIDGLPVISEPASQTPKPPAPAWNASTWQQLSREIWQDFKNLIRVERIDRPEPALLSAEQVYFLKENLRLRLLSARIALLQHDEASYRTDLQVASAWLKKYFNMRDLRSKQALEGLAQLSSSKIILELPDISASLALASKYKLALEARLQEGS